jgi:hypothetical protein
VRAPGRPDRLDRTVLSVIGLVLTAAAAYGLARGAGGFGARRAHDPFLTEWLRRSVRHHQLVVWLVAEALALLVAWLAWRWLRARIPATRTVATVDLENGAGGATTLQGSALCAAVERDLEAGPGVGDARTRLLEGPPNVRLDVRLKVDEDVPVEDVGRLLDHSLFQQLPAALPTERVDARVELQLTESGGRGPR